MKKSKKLIVASTLAIGIGSTAAFAPASISAASDVIIASVDWVNSQINPMKKDIDALEAKVNSMQKEINTLKKQVADGNTGNTGGNEDNNATMPSTVYVAKSSVTIHSGATRDYRVVATKTKGSSLKVIDQHKSASGLWYRVVLGTNSFGWIYSGDISTTQVKQPTSVVTTAAVQLRRGAATSYKVYETVKKGTTLKYISTFTNSSGETWYNVETSKGTRGWIIGTYGEVR